MELWKLPTPDIHQSETGWRADRKCFPSDAGMECPAISLVGLDAETKHECLALSACRAWHFSVSGKAKSHSPCVPAAATAPVSSLLLLPFLHSFLQLWQQELTMEGID